VSHKDSIIKIIDANVNQIHELIQKKTQIWSNYVLFSGLWWLGVGMTIIPWIIWLVIRSQKSSDRLLYAGFFVMTISLILDVLGDQLGFWHYRFNVIPVLPTYAPWDITLMPVAVMLLLQYTAKSNPFIIALLFSLATSYIAEPFFEWLEIYETLSWHYSYSVPIQFVIYITAHYISRRKEFSNLVKS
jgi:hypothetical protein